jgi:hypothetical protein
LKLDIVNGLFEFCGSLMLARNVLLTYRAKQVKGVSLLATSYFMSWGIFNILYYPSLNQHWSFLGGICVAVVNSVWVGQIVYYNHKEFYFGTLYDKISCYFKKLRRRRDGSKSKITPRDTPRDIGEGDQDLLRVPREL